MIPPFLLRKNPGPFERAYYNVKKFTENMHRSAVLQELLEQIKLAEAAVEEAESEAEKELAMVVHEQLEANLSYMIGTGNKENYDESKTGKISRKTIRTVR